MTGLPQLTPVPQEDPLVAAARAAASREVTLQLEQGRAAFGRALQEDPVARRQAHAVAQELGRPVDPGDDTLALATALRNEQELETLRRDFPVLAARMQDYEFASLTHDDLDALKAQESWLGWIEANWTQGRLTTEQGWLGAKLAAGLAGDEDLARIEQVQRQLARAPQSSNFVTRGLGGTLEVLGQMAGQLAVAGGAAAAAGATAALAGPAAPVTVPTAATGAFFATLAPQTAIVEGGSAYLEYLGRGYGEDEAKAAAFGVGLVNGALDSVGLGLVGKGALKVAGKVLLRTVAKKAAVEATKATATGAWGHFAKAYGSALLGETATEVLQELTTVAGGELARRYSRPEMASLLSTAGGREELSSRVFEIAEKTLFSTMILAAPHNVAGLVVDARRAAATEKQTSFLQAFANPEAPSKTRDEAPAVFQQLVADAAGEAVPTLWVDARAVQQVFAALESARRERNAPGLSVEESVRAAMPGVFDEVEATALRGGDILVPTAEFGTKLANTDFARALVPHLRVSEDAMSQADAARHAPILQAYAQQAQEMAREQAASVEEWKKSETAVFDRVQQELRATGRFTNAEARSRAALHRALISTTARRQGTMPHLLDEQFRLTTRDSVQQSAGSAADEFDQQGTRRTDTPEFKAWFGESKVVDEKGAPLVVYHGTSSQEFAEFKAPDSGPNKGAIFFTDSTTDAGVFAGSGTSSGEAYAPKMQGARTVPSYLSLANPMEVDAKGRVFTPDAMQRDIEKARSAGHDGMVVRNLRNFPKAEPSTSYVAFRPEQIKSVNNRGTFDPNDPNILRQLQSTRQPGTKDSVEDPVEQLLTTADYETLLSINGGFVESLADRFTPGESVSWDNNAEKWVHHTQMPAMPRRVRGQSPRDHLERVVEFMVQNILALHDALPSEVRERARLWYDGARELTDRWAVRYRLTPEQVAAVIAVLSPRKDWFQNVSMAERILDTAVGGARFRTWSSEMSAWLQSKKGSATRSALLKRGQSAPEDLSLQQLLDQQDWFRAAVWLRAFDEAHNDKRYRITSPEGGSLGFAGERAGEELDEEAGSQFAWSEFRVIGNALSVVFDGSPQNISRAIGNEHKVRNFYNNIFAPHDPRFVTVDTHAIAAALLRPLAGSAADVEFGLGGAPTEKTFGFGGGYAVFHEAYTRAAKARGVLPREMQSISWESVRTLFLPSAKRAKSGAKPFARARRRADGTLRPFKAKSELAIATDAVWASFANGELSQADAVKRVFELAGGVRKTPWQDVPAGGESAASTYEGAGREQFLEAAVVPTPPSPSRVFLEIAPNPDDAQATQAWDAMAPVQKTRVSARVAWEVVPKVLAAFGTHGRVLMQVGSYEDATNPSLALALESSEHAVEIAALLGDIFAQKSMFVLATEQGPNMVRGGAVTIEMPSGATPEQIHAIYTQLHGLAAPNGKPVVNGQSTADGLMVIGVDESALGLTAEDVGRMVNSALGDRFNVSWGPGFVADIPATAAEGLSYASAQLSERVPTGAPFAQVHADLRSRATAALGSALRDERAGRWFGASADQAAGTAADAAGAGGDQAAAGGVQDRGGVRGSPELLAQQDVSDSRPPLRGLPRLVEVDGELTEFGPFAPARAAAASYTRAAGLDYRPSETYVEVDAKRAERIAAAFETMPHAPEDPEVRAAYAALAAETIAQWRAAKATGLQVEFIEGADPYASNPRKAILDVVRNNHLWVFPTDAGFGGSASADVDIEGNPLLAIVEGETWSGRPVRVNDLFRVVHDYFGHVKEGLGFRARGEENAWQQHMAMFSPLARKALTTETRGQNSWVNFGPFAEANRTASGAATQYAPQKSGVLPAWVWEEGFDEGPELAQPGGDAPRGTFSPSQLRITLNPSADASTWFHEFAHFALTMFERLVETQQAAPDLVADWNGLLSWLGVEPTVWSAMTLEQKRRAHEQFAYSFEEWLFGAEAPGPELKSLFRRISDWLVEAYRGQVRERVRSAYRKETGEELPEMPQEVQQILARMLAAHDTARAATAVYGTVALFQTKAEFLAQGNSEQDWADYQQARTERDSLVEDQLRAASLRTMKWLRGARGRVLKTLQQEAKAAREAARADAEATVAAYPVYRVLAWLQRGGKRSPNRLDLDAVKAALPAEAATDEQLAAIAKPDGADPALVAETYEFRDTRDLVTALLEAPSFEEAVEQEVDRVMLTEHSGLASPEAIEAEIDRALHAEARAQFVAVELRYAARGAEAPARVLLAAAREAAARQVDALKVEELTPHRFSGAEQRAARDALQAMREGSFERLLEAKRREMLQHQLTRAAGAAREDVQKRLEKARRVWKPDEKLGKTHDLGLLAAARALAIRFGLGGTPRQQEELQARSGELLRQIEAYDPVRYGDVVKLLGTLGQGLPEGAATYRQLTYAEFRLLTDTVESLWHEARRRRQVLVAGRKESLDAAVADLGDEIAARDPGTTRAPTALVKAFQGLRAVSRRAESLLDSLGPTWTRVVFRPVQDALDRYRILRNKQIKALADALADLGPLSRAKIDAPEIGYTFGAGNAGVGMAELLGAMLHAGNLSNLSKLLIGRGWTDVANAFSEDGQLNTTQWDKLIERLTEEGVITERHWQWCQRVWDLAEEMKPLAQKTHFELTGAYFEEVKPRPVVVPLANGETLTLRGGYVPAAADLDHPANAAARQYRGLENLDEDHRFAMPTVGAGFTKARIPDFSRPLALDIRLLVKHFDGVARYVHVQPAIRDVSRILQDRELAERMARIDPQMVDGVLRPWLVRAARQAAAMPGMSPTVDAFWRAVRARTGMAMMFGNVSNAVQQLTGWFPAALKVKPSYLFGGLLRSLRKGTADEIAKLSPFMAERLSSQAVDIADEIETMVLNPNMLQRASKAVRQRSYFLQTFVQHFVDTSTWTGAHEQALAEGVDVTEAVARADAAVRLTQGGVLPEQLASFEAGTPFVKVFTQFQGYFNMLANLLGTEFSKLQKSLGGPGLLSSRGFSVLALGFLAPALVADAIARTFRGEWDDEDDDGYQDEVADWLFGGLVRSSLALVPLGGNATAALVNSWNDKPFDDRLGTSASISALEASTVGVVRAIRAAADPEQDLGGKQVKDLLTLLTLLLGAPISAAGRPLGYAIDEAQGKVEPYNTADRLRGYVTGIAAPGTR